MIKVKVKHDITGEQFDRLIVVNRANDILRSQKMLATWNCLCKCGNVVIAPTCALVTGNTRSCGCFKSEINGKNAKKLNKLRIKHDPITFSAKEVWFATYKEVGGISFDDFYVMSQQNCFYCGIIPGTSYNWFKNRPNSYAHNIQNVYFLYNGLDRIDSNIKVHTKENVVACCPICNRAKSNKSFSDFVGYISNIVNVKHEDVYEHRNKALSVVMCDLKKLYFGSSVKATFGNKYNDGNLTIEQFYQLSQLDCYYCGKPPILSNRANRTKDQKHGGEFYYNGLDRVIPKPAKHDYNNVITCCHSCNLAKSYLSFDSFMSWINRITNNYDTLLQANCVRKVE
jgi:hypothetical protein